VQNGSKCFTVIEEKWQNHISFFFNKIYNISMLFLVYNTPWACDVQLHCEIETQVIPGTYLVT